VPAVVIAVLIVIAALSYKTLQFFPSATPVPPLPSDATTAQPEAEPNTQPAITDAGSDPGSAVSAAQLPNASGADSVIETQQLLATLAALDGKKPITAGQAQKWRDSLQQLIQRGSAAVPAIQEFLAQNLDANYAGVSGADPLGYNSLRGALLDALGQIGGPEAIAAMLQTLQTSIYPTDIATLARMLGAQAPGKFQEVILGAVRQQLSLAASDRLRGANVGPLYQVMAESGARGGSVAADLAEYAGKWPYYSIIALAGLADNTGVPLLIQMAQGALPGNPTVAAQALAELAPQNAEASNTLFTLAKSGQLDDATLAQVAPFLGGRQYELTRPPGAPASGHFAFHVTSGNQDYSTSDGANALTADQLTQRISIIDDLMDAVPEADTAAEEALQQQKGALAARQGLH
jgi:hypothetical protein